VVGVEVNRGVIINQKNMSYDEADRLLGSGKNSSLDTLYEVGKMLWSKYCDTEYDIHRMVEIYMLLTNVHVARFLSEKIPQQVLLRKHQHMDSLDKQPVPQIPQAVREKINLMRMDSAVYDVGISNSYHHGVREQYYTHFTSPIRRYADIVVHRMLWSVLNGLEVESKGYGSLNTSQKNIKKAERESYLLKTIFEFYDDGSVYDTDGYIVRIDGNSLLIHMPELKLDCESKLFSNKLRRNLKYSYDENMLKIESPIGNYEVHLGQHIKIRVVISIKAHNVRKKFLVQILDPDPIPYVSAVS
jgi:exoribonuclease R